MRLFDPARPRHAPFRGDVEGEPKLIHPGNGRQLTLPNLYVQVYSEGDIRIRAHMAASARSFRYAEARCNSPAQIGEVFAEFLADPERCLTNRFGWRWPWELEQQQAAEVGRPSRQTQKVSPAALPELKDLFG